MSFVLTEVIHIISTIDDLLSMSERPCPINTSTGYDEDDDEAIFIDFAFALKNGIAKVRIYDSVGFLIYTSQSGEILKNIEFDDREISETNGSFKKALKQIRDFDRQQTSTAKSTHAPIDRASFGLAEVN
ncbi:hypothetical protein [Chamaesiphon sp. GL140_3_metabinner_50]|uniref:hypothetical protein n=1 Tax=Chamaesiphon sp. GL140_3_metabinner_50 TaxID=2970812 RepID=UPI0025DBC8EE|nr:hypothetical protein [Chamaesiphon sp. GL140_3_metabinner_50]